MTPPPTTVTLILLCTRERVFRARVPTSDQARRARISPECTGRLMECPGNGIAATGCGRDGSGVPDRKGVWNRARRRNSSGERGFMLASPAGTKPTFGERQGIRRCATRRSGSRGFSDEASVWQGATRERPEVGRDRGNNAVQTGASSENLGLLSGVAFPGTRPLLPTPSPVDGRVRRASYHRRGAHRQ